MWEIDEQMLPILHWEKFISPVSATGLMMNWALASHDDEENGQQVFESVSHPLSQEHPSAHCRPVNNNSQHVHMVDLRRAINRTISTRSQFSHTAQLTIAPKLCPISCAMTCHSVRPAVETAVPETTDGLEPDAVCWQSVASQAMPTSEPVGQPLMRCHRPAPSSPLSPRHWEKRDRRSLRVTESEHATFQGASDGAVLGQL